MRTTSYATFTVAVLINWLCGSVKSDLLSQWCSQNGDICQSLLEEIRGKAKSIRHKQLGYTNKQLTDA